jgi:DNA-binding NarL/FixJ family response regulator
VLDDLIRAINTVVASQSYLSPQIASIVLEGITKDSIFTASDRLSDTLTQKERQVLVFLSEGMTAKQVASQLSLSVKTIEASRRHIMEKAHVDNLVDLTKYAIRQGLTTI